MVKFREIARLLISIVDIMTFERAMLLRVHGRARTIDIIVCFLYNLLYLGSLDRSETKLSSAIDERIMSSP